MQRLLIILFIKRLYAPSTKSTTTYSEKVKMLGNYPKIPANPQFIALKKKKQYISANRPRDANICLTYRERRLRCHTTPIVMTSKIPTMMGLWLMSSPAVAIVTKISHHLPSQSFILYTLWTQGSFTVGPARWKLPATI